MLPEVILATPLEYTHLGSSDRMREVQVGELSEMNFKIKITIPFCMVAHRVFLHYVPH